MAETRVRTYFHAHTWQGAQRLALVTVPVIAFGQAIYSLTLLWLPRYVPTRVHRVLEAGVPNERFCDTGQNSRYVPEWSLVSDKPSHGPIRPVVCHKRPWVGRVQPGYRPSYLPDTRVDIWVGGGTTARKGRNISREDTRKRRTHVYRSDGVHFCPRLFLETDARVESLGSKH